MKNKLMKFAAVFAVVCMMSLSLAACGEQPSEPSSDASTPAENTQLSEEDYTAKVQEIYDSITKASLDAMTGVDTTDVNAIMDATKSLIAAVKPFYTELRDLVAPEKYESAQAKIKSGCEASLRALEISLEIFDNATDMDKVAELQQEAADLQEQALQLAEGLTEAGVTVTQ